jgi:hypothetical protein
MTIRKKAIKPTAKPQKGTAKKMQSKPLVPRKAVNLKTTASRLTPADFNELAQIFACKPSTMACGPDAPRYQQPEHCPPRTCSELRRRSSCECHVRVPPGRGYGRVLPL